MQNVCKIFIPRYKEKMNWWWILSNPVDKISHKRAVRTILPTYIRETTLLVQIKKKTENPNGIKNPVKIEDANFVNKLRVPMQLLLLNIGPYVIYSRRSKM
jgi:hypothetical protein